MTANRRKKAPHRRRPLCRRYIVRRMSRSERAQFVQKKCSFLQFALAAQGVKHWRAGTDRDSVLRDERPLVAPLPPPPGAALEKTKSISG